MNKNFCPSEVVAKAVVLLLLGHNAAETGARAASPWAGIAAPGWVCTSCSLRSAREKPLKMGASPGGGQECHGQAGGFLGCTSCYKVHACPCTQQADSKTLAAFARCWMQGVMKQLCYRSVMQA